jgi:hypothetical protein
MVDYFFSNSLRRWIGHTNTTTTIHTTRYIVNEKLHHYIKQVYVNKVYCENEYLSDSQKCGLTTLERIHIDHL